LKCVCRNSPLGRCMIGDLSGGVFAYFPLRAGSVSSWAGLCRVGHEVGGRFLRVGLACARCAWVGRLVGPR
jgi:hypothetical protein